MNRELWLLRHAKAEIGVDIDDFDRALKKRGIKAANRLGLWMRQQQLLPDWVISSPALRAISTARLVCPFIGVAEQDIHQDKRLYMADVVHLKNVLAECPKTAKRVLLVGHNPGLEALINELTSNLPTLKKFLPTAALVRLQLPEDWQQIPSSCAELSGITHAKALLDNDK